MTGAGGTRHESSPRASDHHGHGTGASCASHVPTAPTAFVGGATGLTGRHVVERLRARGIRSVAHVRPDSPNLEAWRRRLELLDAEVDATPWQEAAMTEKLRNLAPDLVFSLLGTTRARMRAIARAGGEPATAGYEAVDYGLTALLLRASMASPSRPRFVYLSAVGARPKTRSAYLAVRGRVEEELRDSGLPYVIARPSFILGDRDQARPVESAAATTLDAALAVVGRLGARRMREHYRSMDAADLAEALVRNALEPASDALVLEAEALRSS